MLIAVQILEKPLMSAQQNLVNNFLELENAGGLQLAHFAQFPEDVVCHWRVRLRVESAVHDLVHLQRVRRFFAFASGLFHEFDDVRVRLGQVRVPLVSG